LFDHVTNRCTNKFKRGGLVEATASYCREINEGTGKSWFQPYALRRLLQGYRVDHEYLFVIRQEDQVLFLMDLADAQVRQITVQIQSAR
jgi:hypothetical protein